MSTPSPTPVGTQTPSPSVSATPSPAASPSATPTPTVTVTPTPTCGPHGYVPATCGTPEPTPMPTPTETVAVPTPGATLPMTGEAHPFDPWPGIVIAAVVIVVGWGLIAWALVRGAARAENRAKDISADHTGGQLGDEDLT